MGRPYVHASDTYILATLNTVCHASPPVTYPPPILLCRNVFFCTSAFLSLPAPGLFSCSRLRGTQGARRNNAAKKGALAEVRGMCSGGSKSKVTTGRPSEHVEPSRSMQTHVQVNKMSDGSCDTWDLECRQCRQILLGDGKVFPRHQLASHATTFSNNKLQCPWPRKDSLFSRTILRGRYDHSMGRPSPAIRTAVRV